MKISRRLNRMTAVLLSALMVCTAAVLPAGAARIDERTAGAAAVAKSGETSGDYEYSVNDDGTVTITGYTGSPTELTIPKTIDGKSVTSIGSGTFSDCTSLTSITIPSGVTSIGNDAFRDCTSLPSITIPDSVTNIGDYAFSNCTSLTSITIPDSVTSIGDYAFDGCTSLTSITIPDSVTSIGESAFQSCTSLTSITIPSGVTSIGDYAFSRCESLTSIMIPSGVTSISDDAFYNCTGLTSITIPDSVTSIGDYAFSRCESLTSIEVSENNANYKSVDGILYDKDVTTLFACPGGKTSVTIPSGVTSIGSYAFWSCESLTSITIPDSVTSIGESAFQECTSLTSITIPDSVTSIGYEAFYGCTSLTSITIPDSVTSIGSWAFEYCESLTSITIPSGVTSIGYEAFEYCTSLSDVYYTGTAEQWNNINIESGNYFLTDANRHYVKSLYCSVTWKNEDGTVLETDENVEYGTMPTYDGEIPSKANTAQYSYTFGWDKEITKVTGDTTYTAVFTPTVNKYTVTWKNEDETTLKTDKVEYGTVPSFNGNTPTKEKTAQYTYTFKGWDKEPISVTEDVTYTAEFTRTLNTYTVKWKDFDGTVLETDSNVEYGTIPTYDGETPTRPNEGQNVYTFKGWDKEITAVTGDVTYTTMWNKTRASDSTDTNTEKQDTTTDNTDTASDSTDTNTEKQDTSTDDTDTASDSADTNTEKQDTSTDDTDTSTDTSNEPPVTNPEDFDYDRIKGGALCIKLYMGDDEVISIPSEIDGLPVTQISRSHTDKNDSITKVRKVYIPDSVTVIGDYAFADYTSLEEIVIPDSVTEIKGNAFVNCESLTSLVIPESVKKIGMSAFYNCSGLKSIQMPSNMDQIGQSAFFKCDSLEEIVIPDGITKIESALFRECRSLTTVTIPKSVTEIDYKVFESCRKLKDVYFGGNEARWNSIVNNSKVGFLESAQIHFNDDDDFKTDEPEVPETPDTPDKPEKPDRLTGDVDGDGKVSAKDSMAIQRYTINLKKLDDIQLLAADVNGDGKVSAKDALDILRYTIHMSKNESIGKIIA